ncbi:hypothetical protein GCM10023264_20380 [Sphingomonas daechungensis]|uniref:DUF4149 domain-containing protein n=1 Tax=Sphingomonas daechungensis TaxID=1176646 RepID=A0ABX6T2S5_9SPHN|nr:hypothetical protein [Sphingomonas daechungensis]QNP43839.1 hypothetical protein H9L15_04160 [Sphingomonas daechungensis]
MRLYFSNGYIQAALLVILPPALFVFCSRELWTTDAITAFTMRLFAILLLICAAFVVVGYRQVSGKQSSKAALTLSRAVVCTFSVGWLFPGWLAVHFYLDHVRQVTTDGPKYAVPFLELSGQALNMASIWAAAVVIFWAWRATR